VFRHGAPFLRLRQSRATHLHFASMPVSALLLTRSLAHFVAGLLCCVLMLSGQPGRAPQTGPAPERGMGLSRADRVVEQVIAATAICSTLGRQAPADRAPAHSPHNHDCCLHAAPVLSARPLSVADLAARRHEAPLLRRAGQRLDIEWQAALARGPPARA